MNKLLSFIATLSLFVANTAQFGCIMLILDEAEMPSELIEK